MKHDVKVGDRFRLGAWEWEVISKHMDGFEAKRDTADGTCLFGDDEADKLDWITPKVTFTKEQESALIERWTILSSSVHFRDKTVAGSQALLDFHTWINDHTEKE